MYVTNCRRKRCINRCGWPELIVVTSLLLPTRNGRLLTASIPRSLTHSCNHQSTQLIINPSIHSINQSLNQSINQSITQWLNHSINQSLSQLHQSIDHHFSNNFNAAVFPAIQLALVAKSLSREKKKCGISLIIITVCTSKNASGTYGDSSSAGLCPFFTTLSPF